MISALRKEASVFFDIEIAEGGYFFVELFFLFG